MRRAAPTLSSLSSNYIKEIRLIFTRARWIGLNSLTTNALARRVIANWADQANRRAAAGHVSCLIGLFAPKIFRGSESDDRFTSRGNLSTRITLSTAALPITWIMFAPPPALARAMLG
jgi:hypothetical protein